MITNYLKKIGQNSLIRDIKRTKLNTFVTESFEQIHPIFSEVEIMSLYTYPIPRLTANGSCSITGELEKFPYNLAHIFQLHYDVNTLQNNQHTYRLWHLKNIVYELQKQVNVDWLGIYRKIHKETNLNVLLKEAYVGTPSRPEFPLTKNFAKKSNNSTVGLTGKAVLVQSVDSYKGPYYKCDGKVQSEFCIPILNTTNQVIGIIDAESFNKNHFNSKKLLQIAKVAYDLGQINIGMMRAMPEASQREDIL